MSYKLTLTQIMSYKPTLTQIISHKLTLTQIVLKTNLEPNYVL